MAMNWTTTPAPLKPAYYGLSHRIAVKEAIIRARQLSPAKLPKARRAAWLVCCRAEKKIARHGACLQNAAGKTIGQVTSGLHSPSLQTAIALGYVLADAASQAITAEVRGEWTPCTTVKLPFIAHNYHRGKSS